MKILAIDSSTTSCGVAVTDNNSLKVEAFLDIEARTHSEKLMPLLAEVLKVGGLKLKDMDGLAVTIGPGSFTGLRLALATIKTLAQITGLPLAGITTLDALSLNAKGRSELICPLLPARKGEYYFALYREEKLSFIRCSAYMVLKVEEVVSLLRPLKKDIIFVGEGFDLCREELKKGLGSHLSKLLSVQMPLKPSHVAFLGERYILEGKISDPLTLTPLYLRSSAAEEAKLL